MARKKYKLSFFRIVSRLLITGVVVVIFGISMIPFLRDATGLFDGQQAAIGSENLWKIVILWGIFSALFSAFSFWLKRLRMVAVFLLTCWVGGTILVIGINLLLSSQPYARCNRTNPYDMPKEFSRALDLIAQRADVENNESTYYGIAYGFRNCLNIYYSDDLNKTDFEGAFITNSDTQNLQIIMSPIYKSYDDLSIATILIHELTHVGQEISARDNNVKSACYDDEADAFTAQSIFLSQLNDEERRSIYARLREDAQSNPALNIVLGVSQQTDKAYNACSQIRDANALTDQQFNECVWTGTKNNMNKIVRETPSYIEECKAY